MYFANRIKVEAKLTKISILCTQQMEIFYTRTKSLSAIEQRNKMREVSQMVNPFFATLSVGSPDSRVRDKKVPFAN